MGGRIVKNKNCELEEQLFKDGIVGIEIVDYTEEEAV